MLYRHEDCICRKINFLEKVQRKATKLIDPSRDKSYNDRLKPVKLITLEMRQTRGDHPEVFKIFKEFDQIDWGRFLR
jgi:hypothetical protein